MDSAPPKRPTPRHRAQHAQPRVAHRIIQVLVALGAAAAMVVTGVGFLVTHGVLSGIMTSSALGANEPRSAGGAMNILLIGLDSRRDQDGNALPSAVLDKLHAGDSESGGYNANTLILVRVSADGRVVAFSIPRDDYVAVSDIPGYNHIKIKEAYGLAKAVTEQRLIEQGVTDQRHLETQGRDAGRIATIRAVRKLTGVPIDYFAEINLVGFYDLTQSLGGVEVCLNNAVYDEYSGADFPAGRQKLNAEQALAFVRQRHGLENGDLDRTHRQQAFLVSVMRQLEDSGSLTDLGEFTRVIDVARRNLVLSHGWGEAQFKKLASLASGDVEFRTLPVVGYETIDGQDVNIVDPVAIKAEVAAAFDPPPNPAIANDGTAPDADPASIDAATDPASTDDGNPSSSESSPDQGAPIDSSDIPCVN